MEYRDIIENGELIYSSHPSDSRLTNWSLNSTQLGVSYYKVTPISSIDKLICSLLAKENGKMSKLDLELTLGFDVAAIEFHGQTFYEDIAEVEMFNRLLSQLEEWKLVVIEKVDNRVLVPMEEDDKDVNNTNTGNVDKEHEVKEPYTIEIIRLTKLGELALENGLKYSFYHSNVILYVNYFSTGDKIVDSQFVYPRELGIYAKIIDKKDESINPDEFDLDCSSPFKQRLQLQLDSTWDGQIYNIVPLEKTLPMEKSNVDFKLYKYENDFYLLAFKNGAFSNEITKIIYAGSNSKMRNQRIKLSLYYRLINDENSLFDYDEVSPFWDVLDSNEYNLLLQDHRINWAEDSLFNLIVTSEFCTSKTWTTITQIVPLDVLKTHLVEYDDFIDWLVISSRIDADFILSNISYNWSFETILSRSDISIDQAQKILTLPLLRDTNFDWDLIERFLTVDFVRDNVMNLKIDYYHLTSWLPKEELSLIFENVNESWNWDYITAYLSLDEIIEKIDIVDSLLNSTTLIDRCFSSESNVEKILQSQKLRDYFIKSISRGKFDNFTLRERKQYLWTDSTIKYLEEIGLLCWESKQYEKGFAQFSFVHWTKTFFAKYYNKLVSEVDRTYVSEVISDMSLITDYPEFRWDWNALSSNKNFAYKTDFINTFSKQINACSWVRFASTQSIEANFDILNLNQVFNDEFSVESISANVTKEFIVEHKDLTWDTTAFTNAVGPEALIYNSLLKQYSSRWNWELLSSMAPLSLIIDNIDCPWENGILTKAILSSKSNYSELIFTNINRIDWLVLSTNIDYYDFETIAEQFSEQWDWDVVNGRFAPLYSSELLNNKILRNNLDWEKISCEGSSQSLIGAIASNFNLLNWDKVTKRLCSILTLQEILNDVYMQHLDWIYMSEYADIQLVEHSIEYFQISFDWTIITGRLSAEFIVDNLASYQTKWDWNLIWGTKITNDFAKERIQLISDALNCLSDDLRESQWKAFTRVFSNEDLLQLTNQFTPKDNFFWDYEFVYNNNVSDLALFISKPHVYLDWAALSLSKAANEFFYHDAQTFDVRIWKVIVRKNLSNPLYQWNFHSLTRLESVQNEHAIFFNIDTDKWDWDYISEKGSCLLASSNGEANLRKYRKNINFALLSKREDICLTEDIIESYIDETWDWSSLSANPKVELSIDFVYNHREKDWNWTEVSRNTSIKWSAKKSQKMAGNLFKDDKIVVLFDWAAFVSRNDIILDNRLIKQIHDHIINYWNNISSNNRFIPSLESLSIAEVDGVNLTELNWNAISNSKNLIQFPKDKEGNSKPNTEFIKRYASLINWEIATQNSVFDIYNNSLVGYFKMFVDWSYISKEIGDDKLDIAYLNKFKNYLDWHIINRRLDYQLINEKALCELGKFLDWTKVSKLELSFTKELLDLYVDNWDWSVLLRNKAFKRIFNDDMLGAFNHKLNIAKFIDQFNDQPAKIYHFTHIFNVLEVLKTQKILSRNRATELGKLKFDSAGGVVGRTAKAHPYARFYFRPNTPTQFYNECLGWDCDMTVHYGKKDVSYYSQALNLGLPKCPIPVFLEFDLGEVLTKMSSRCFYSNGNMQTNWAKVYKVEEEPDNLRTEYLFNNMSDAFFITLDDLGDYDHGYHMQVLNKIKDQSQQEFLIKDEFDFSKIDSLKIHCYDENAAEMLRTYLGKDPIAEHIIVGGCFTYQNRNLNFDINEENHSLSISSNYNGQGDAYFLVKGNVDIINVDDVKRQVADGVVMYPKVEIKNNGKSCEIYFVDKRARTTDWLVYSNSVETILNGKHQCYHIERNILDDFRNIGAKVMIDLKRELFYSHMVNSYHGIAHTSRVLFATHMITSLSEGISEDIRVMAYYAAIIHDLGKISDREGSIHGLKSVNRCCDLIDSIPVSVELRQRLKDAIIYHSIEDNLCPVHVQEDVLWKILKDADALDRNRFSSKGCDIHYLRMPIFQTEDGKDIIQISNILPSVTRECKWDNPYDEIIKALETYVI
jgi:hypothetical protein